MPKKPVRTVTLLAAVSAPLLVPIHAARAQDFVAGELLVRQRAARSFEAQQIMAALGLSVRQTDPWSGVQRVRAPGGAEQDLAAVLSNLDAFEYAEPNYIGYGGVTPDDTFYTSQWHLKNTGQSGGSPGADIDAEPAWGITTGSPAIGIAVLDSGIRAAHPDFVGRIAGNGYDFVNNDANPEDDHGHGTWVTGVIAANADNAFAVAGLDWRCTIIPIKVLNSNNAGTTFNLASGINHAASQANVHIINLSLINYPGASTLINALQNARDAGKTVIACAGNGGIGNADTSYPGASTLTISVGATTRTDTRWTGSGTGQSLDFVAPGASIVTTSASVPITNTAATVTGCSFATPIASAIAGLLMSRSLDLGLGIPDHAQIFDWFKQGAEDLVGNPSEDTPGWDAFHGWGRLNAHGSLLAVQPGCRPDLNGDGNLNFFDISLFVALFQNQDPAADWNEDGLFNFFDFSAFLGEFNAGCP